MATGDWYVHIDEDGHAISVAEDGVGPNGGWVGISLARMTMPSKHKTRQQIDDAAKVMAAAPLMLAALKKGQSAIELVSTILHDLEVRGIELSSIHDHRWGAATGVCDEIKNVIAKATA